MPLAYSTGLSLPLFTAVDVRANHVTLAVFETAEEHQKWTAAESSALTPEDLSEFSIGSVVCRHPDSEDVLCLVDSVSIDIAHIDEWVNPRTLGPCTSLYITFDPDQRRLLPPYNKMAESYLSKDHGNHHINKIQRNVIAQILMPFGGDEGDGFAVRFTVNEDIGHWSGQAAEKIDNNQKSYLDFSMRLFPTLQVDHKALSLPVGQIEHITVQLLGPDGSPIKRAGVGLHAKCDAGYLARREAVTDSLGRARFPYLALGLDQGDEASVEFGFKWYSNVARCQVQVSA